MYLSKEYNCESSYYSIHVCLLLPLCFTYGKEMTTFYGKGVTIRTDQFNRKRKQTIDNFILYLFFVIKKEEENILNYSKKSAQKYMPCRICTVQTSPSER